MSAVRQMNRIRDIMPRPTRSRLEAVQEEDDLFSVGRGQGLQIVADVDTGLDGRFTYESFNQTWIDANSWRRAGMTVIPEEGHQVLAATLDDLSFPFTPPQVVLGMNGEPGIRYVDVVDQRDVTLFGGSDDEDDAVIAEFARGVSGFPAPAQSAVDIARRLVRIASSRIEEPEISVDMDGELSFDLPRDDGYQVFAELSIDGRLDVGVYDEKNDMVLHDTRATVTVFEKAVVGGSLSSTGLTNAGTR